MELHSYEGLHDLKQMLDLLAKGRQAENGTYYVHRGDLQWWLFYTDVPEKKWQSSIRLLKENGNLLGWILLPMDDCAFDVYVEPGLRGTSREHELLARAVEQISALDKVQTVWVAEDDSSRIDWLAQNGFSPEEKHLILFKRLLSGPLTGSPLPEGFSARASRGPQDAQSRATASHASFGSTMPFDKYQARMLRFMQSPVYVKEHDVLITAPDGQVSAFCCIWTDNLNKMGYFEPVGTHPDFQGKGLGKSLLFEGLRRLQSEGMAEASVCSNSDNPAAVRLYESVGFQRVKRLLTFTKRGSTVF